VGWLTKRLLREQSKLLCQNGKAAEGTLAGYFHADPVTQSWLAAISREVRETSLRYEPHERLSPDDLERQLQINRELRRLYDTTASRYLENFDTAHTPLGGWKFWFERQGID
jgi:hypothetical protein